jgi:type IV pilus assembly protein PilM
MKSFASIFSSFSSGNNRSGGVVGIDIGSSSIKVVELQEKKGVVTLGTYGELQLGPYAKKEIGESVILTASQEQEALVDVIRESGVTAKRAVFAMPLSSSFVTNVTIDAEPFADLSALVRLEARKVIPASLSEVTLDWAEVETDTGEEKKEKKKADEKESRNVLIAAIQNVALDRFKALMQFVGIEQPPTEIECFSAIRALYTAKDVDMAVIDIGATSSKLYISKNGLLMRIHRIRAGGAIATGRIASVLNIEFEAAEEKKHAADSTDTNFSELKRAHNSSYERAFKEFSQVIREYETSTGVSIPAVYVSGGGAMFPGTETLLKDILGREVIRAHPFAKVAYPAFMQDTIKEIGPSFSIALGAAIRAFE